MKRRFVSALSTLLVLVSSTLAAQAPATVTGRITNPEGQPEAAVLVRIEAMNVGASTAADGQYRLVVPGARIRDGQPVTITASRTGLSPVSRTLTLRPGAVITQNFQMATVMLHLEDLIVTGTPGPIVLGRAPCTVPSITAKDIQVPAGQPNTEEYDAIQENGWRAVSRDPLSTFGIDVDPASYSNVRRFVRDGAAPPRDAVRIEELVNYFSYGYPDPTGEHPFAVVTEVGAAPWNPRHQLVHVGIQGRRMPSADLPPSSLVFLVDVSGSMQDPDKLPLVKASLRLLVEELDGDDRVALVVYAGAAGLVLDATPGDRREAILDAIERLEAGGSTAGAEGIQLAYDVARRNFIPGGNNRVILATDGDFNVGVSSQGELVQLIEARRREGTFLTVLGFGRGNLADARMEQLADHGNGNYAYIDGLLEARKVLVQEMGGTLFTIARDVKLQVEFNPQRVHAYRLIGYENRLLAAEDFADDRKDAGDLGAGHSVTALYEVVPVGAESSVDVGEVAGLRYQRPESEPVVAFSGELMNVNIRYKRPDGEQSVLLSHAVRAPARDARPSDDFRFAAAVAQFGMLLRASEHRGRSSVDGVLRLARGSLGEDPHGHRRAFLRLVEDYRRLPGGGRDPSAR
jgi:Ca-activated chloride channel family protein